MGYWEQSLLSIDQDFRQRIASCVAKEGLSPEGEHPTTTADKIQWEVAAAPGFAEAYTYAIANEVPNPGRDATVITDEQLLSAVTAVLTPAPPNPL